MNNITFIVGFIIIILLVIIFRVNAKVTIEGFNNDFPFFNFPIGTTRNMSYDLRGDVPIPYFIWTPFNMTTRVPIQNRPLWKWY